jgi:hypothetical protein
LKKEPDCDKINRRKQKIEKNMTKEEILHLIDQNRDLLTPENYQGILKYAEVFTEDEKKRIAAYLEAAQWMMRAHSDFIKKRNALLGEAVEKLKEEKGHMVKEVQKARAEEESRQASKDSSEAESMISGI